MNQKACPVQSSHEVDQVHSVHHHCSAPKPVALVSVTEQSCANRVGRRSVGITVTDGGDLLLAPAVIWRPVLVGPVVDGDR